eukprot:GHVN01097412.1.p1 GENE.GHVN01097412.1~~GHVN01097412.1.p1  ORF type:complete len:110 (-),score=14.39 GHVN01097412.1:157-486(-)
MELISITREIFEMRELIDSEKKARIEQERMIAKRLAQAQHVFNSKIEDEKETRTELIEALRKEVDGLNSQRHQNQDKFKEFAMGELATLKKGELILSNSNNKLFGSLGD